MALDLFADDNLITIDVDLHKETELIANILINEGRRREREEIVEALMTLKDISCCCDTSTFGQHYLSGNEPDNIIKLINSRKIG